MNHVTNSGSVTCYSSCQSSRYKAVHHHNYTCFMRLADVSMMQNIIQLLTSQPLNMMRYLPVARNIDQTAYKCFFMIIVLAK